MVVRLSDIRSGQRDAGERAESKPRRLVRLQDLRSSNAKPSDSSSSLAGIRTKEDGEAYARSQQARAKREQEQGVKSYERPTDKGALGNSRLAPVLSAQLGDTLDALTFGLTDKLTDKAETFIRGDRERTAEEQKAGQITSIAGTIGAGAGAYRAAAAATKPLARQLPQLAERAAGPIAARVSPQAAALTRIGAQSVGRGAGMAATGAAAGALYQAPIEATEEMFGKNDQTIRQRLADIGESATIGAILDPAIEGYLGVASSLRRDPLKDEIRSFIRKTEAPAQAEDVMSAHPAGRNVRTTKPTTAAAADPGAELAGNFRRYERIQQEYNDAVEQQYQYLKQSMAERGGVQQGNVIRNADGEVVDRVGRISSNPRWYRDFFAETGRQPTDKDLRQLAERHVKEGFADDTAGNIPPWRPPDIEDIDSELASIREALETTTAPAERAALEQVAATLENSRGVVRQQLPEGVQGRVRGGGGEAPLQPTTSAAVVQQASARPGATVQRSQNKSDAILFREPNPDADVKPIARREVAKNISKRFGIPIRTGRMGKSKGAAGIYKVRPEVVRTELHHDIDTYAHELGHHLDKQHGLQDAATEAELLNLLQTNGTINVSAYKPDELHAEGVAEYLRLYLTDPDIAQRVAPRFTQLLAQKLPDDIKMKLSETQHDIARWIDQGYAEQFRSQVNRTGKDIDRTFSDRVDKTYTALFDKLYPIAQAERAVSGSKALGDATESAYKKARLALGAPKKAQLVLQPLRDTLKKLDRFGYSMKDLGDYAAAKHAQELEAQGIQSGFSTKQIDAVLNKYGTPEMQALQQDLVAYNDRLLDMLVEGEILSADAVQAMRDKYKDYVPFYRFFEEDMTSGLGGGKGFADLANPVKRMKGSSRDIIDPLESMIKNTFAVVNAVEKNKVGLELARLSNIEGAGRWIEKLDGAAPVKSENIVTVYQGGKRVQYQLDPELYRAVKALDEDSANVLVKLLSVPASMLRAGATLTPEFMLRNPIRDQFQAFVVSEFGYNPLIDLPRGLFYVLRGKLGKNGDAIYNQWVESGGGYGNMLSLDRNYLREQLKHLRNERSPWAKLTVPFNPKNWMRWLQAASELSEEATKVGEFARGVRKGVSPEEAAFQSRDLMDFGRVGTNVRQVNRVISFLNANIQGKDRIARAFKDHPLRTTIRAIEGITVPALAVYGWNKWNSNEKQQETLRNAPQWLRDTFFLVSVPGTDVVARIPKPFDLAPVFANLPENIMRWLDDNDPQGAGEFAKSAAIDMLKIPYMMTGLTPIIENATNYSFFTGGPIVPARDQDLLPEDQYGVNTSLTARTIGQALGYSPYKVDNFIRGYGAGLGRYATSGTDALLELAGAGQLPPTEQKHVSEWPVINAFTVDSTGGGKVMDDFYKQLDKATQQSKSNEKNGRPDPELDRALKMLQTASRDIGQMRKQQRSVQGSYEMQPAEKREHLDMLDERMRERARRVLEILNER